MDLALNVNNEISWFYTAYERKDKDPLTNFILHYLTSNHNLNKKILVTGTCYEYGLQEGKLNEEQNTYPHNFYALAKDTLRKHIEIYYEFPPVFKQEKTINGFYQGKLNQKNLEGHLMFPMET